MLKKNIIFLEKSVNFLYSIKWNFIKLFKEYNLIKKFFKNFLKKKNNTIKLGIDPRNRILHLGHFILINRFNYLKILNLNFIILIGNFTAFIGDSFSKINKRILIKKNILKINIFFFLKQLKVLIKFKEVKIYYNNDWFLFFNINEILFFFSKININFILKKKNFSIKNNISIIEIIYPILQSYDSFFLKSFIEVGGLDQEFNFKITNIFLQKLNFKKQIVLLNNLLIGLDGLKKMSKSILNFISFNSKFIVNFEKFLKIPFNILENYFNLLYLKNFKNFFLKKFFYFFFLKKKLFYFLIKNVFGKNYLFIFFKKKKFFIKKFFFKKKFLTIYKLYVLFFKKKSKNNFKKKLKKKKILINKIFLRNCNLIINKGFYFFNLNKKFFWLKIF